MFDYETKLSGIEFKIRQLIDANNHMRATLLAQQEQIELLTEEINNKDVIINQLKEQNNILKLRNTLVQKGDSAEIKLTINKLIRNIDKSINLLSKVE